MQNLSVTILGHSFWRSLHVHIIISNELVVAAFNRWVEIWILGIAFALAFLDRLMLAKWVESLEAKVATHLDYSLDFFKFFLKLFLICLTGWLIRGWLMALIHFYIVLQRLTFHSIQTWNEINSSWELSDILFYWINFSHHFFLLFTVFIFWNRSRVSSQYLLAGYILWALVWRPRKWIVNAPLNRQWY